MSKLEEVLAELKKETTRLEKQVALNNHAIEVLEKLTQQQVTDIPDGELLDSLKPSGNTVLDLMQTKPNTVWTTRVLREETGYAAATVWTALSHLKRLGLAEKLASGKYQLTPEGRRVGFDELEIRIDESEGNEEDI